MEPALHQAAKNGQEQAVWLLLQNGADVNARDSYRRTALHWAAEYGYKAVALLLLENGVDIEAKGIVGWTALHCAASNGHEAVVRLLLEKGADIEAKENNGQTALHWAAWNGHEAVVRLLLQKGADVQAKGKNGQTALNWATVKGHMAIVQLLTAATKSSWLSPPGIQLPPRPHSSNGIPMRTPYYNPLPQTPQFNQFIPPPPSAMQIPSFGYNRVAQSHPTTAFQQGFVPPWAVQQNAYQVYQPSFGPPYIAAPSLPAWTAQQKAQVMRGNINFASS